MHIFLIFLHTFQIFHTPHIFLLIFQIFSEIFVRSVDGVEEEKLVIRIFQIYPPWATGRNFFHVPSLTLTQGTPQNFSKCFYVMISREEGW